MLELAGTGDDGTTGLLGGGRAAKDDPRIEAFGTIDEASSALGLARSLTRHPGVGSICEELQRGLYAVGAELGTNPSAHKTFVLTAAADVERLEKLMAEIEAEAPMPEGLSSRGQPLPRPRSTWRAPSRGGRSAAASRCGARVGCQIPRLGAG